MTGINQVVFISVGALLDVFRTVDWKKISEDLNFLEVPHVSILR
ncbi:MAG: hypothetical protein AAB407_01435 [Patescibacteria group bacterium]